MEVDPANHDRGQQEEGQGSSIPAAKHCVICLGSAITETSLLLACLHAVCSKECLNKANIQRCPGCKATIERDGVAPNMFFRSHDCNICLRGLEIVSCCQTCGHVYCSACTEQHKLGKSTKQHELGPVTVKLQQQMDKIVRDRFTCETHGNNVAACLTCEKPVCYTCHSVETENHDLKHMNQFVETICGQFRGLYNPLRGFLASKSTKIEKYDSANVGLGKARKDLEYQANTVAQVLPLLLEKRHLKLADMVSVAAKMRTDEIELRQTNLTTLASQIQQALYFIPRFLASDMDTLRQNQSVMIGQIEELNAATAAFDESRGWRNEFLQKDSGQRFNYAIVEDLEKCLLETLAVKITKSTNN